MNESLIVEAESMSLDTYFVTGNDSASAGQSIILSAGFPADTGTASFDFAGISGEYDIAVRYFDHKNGSGQLELEQNNNILDSWNLDRNFYDFNADEIAIETRTVATGVEVNQGDSFTLTGREYWFEGVEVDYVEFIPVNSEPSVLALGESILTTDEGAGEINIPVVRTGNLAETVSLDFQTFAETAVAGEDFTAQEGTLTFEPGETTKNITIAIADDQIVESAETFSITIDNVAGNGTLDAPRTARITIEDNETPVDAVLLVESDGNTTTAEAGLQDSYNITLGRQPNSNVTVNLTPDDQLTVDAASLTFTPDNWDVPQTVNVGAIDDDLVEGEHQGVVSHSVTSEDSSFDGFALSDVVVNIQDNDSDSGGNSGTFVLETLASGYDDPTAIDWTPSGDKVFVAQQNGVVELIDNGVQADVPFIDISAQVNDTRDRGLLGLAVHPDFPNQPYVYLAFTYDPPEVFENSGLAGSDQRGNRPSRVIRVEADPNTNFTTAIPGSEFIIAGTNSTWSNISRPDANSTNDLNIPPSGITAEGENIRDYLATDSESHSIGALQFGTDGSLFIANGDGTSYNVVDPRTVRVQDVDNLSGKILRVDPLTGEGLGDNPFFDGDPNSNRSKVYSLGLRNPFRFTINPDTNQPVIGDVGWKTWEEINTGTGSNFGWPYFEGGNGESLQQREYEALPEAQEFYASGDAVTAPLYARNHNDGAVAIIMGDYYEGGDYPDNFDGALFYSDFGDSTVRYLTFDNGGATVNTFQDNISGIVQLSTGPDGNLYGVDRRSGQIITWSYETEDAEDITGDPGFAPRGRSSRSIAPEESGSISDRRDADGLGNGADGFILDQSL
ncbi:MAG: PQQ-dependent sugar dehydrogenase [Cyanobacteria bacterium J06635_13]